MNLDLNKRDLELIKVALERLSSYVTDKEYHSNLLDKVKGSLEEVECK
jgi:hypothetical protein